MPTNSNLLLFLFALCLKLRKFSFCLSPFPACLCLSPSENPGARPERHRHFRACTCPWAILLRSTVLQTCSQEKKRYFLTNTSRQFLIFFALFCRSRRHTQIAQNFATDCSLPSGKSHGVILNLEGQRRNWKRWKRRLRAFQMKWNVAWTTMAMARPYL